MNCMISQNKKHILMLLNNGALTIENIEWYLKQGYAIICKNKIAIDIIKEDK